SEHTKRDIIEFYDIPEVKIRVVYQTCGTIFQRPVDDSVPPLIDFEIKGQTLPEDYMLFVGSIIPRKNLEGCIRALETMPKSLRLPLVVVGRGKAHKAHLQRLLLEKGLEQEVLFCRDVGMEALRYLYQKARIFLYPSFYEGFGLPVLEALFAGVPVITADVASLPEAGGGGALYVNPHDPEALADAIVKILTDTELCLSLKKKGWQHAQQFTSQKLTAQMMALYRELAPGNHP
ncbi:MAG: glycosyltransferase family 1 protein, partial [Bacteroidetes bacterium]